MKIKLHKLAPVVISILAFFSASAQIHKASEIEFCPPGVKPEQLPNLGLTNVAGAETFLLFEPPTNRSEYNQPFTGTYSHHSHIIYFRGVVIAIWSNHFGDEDSPGQYVRYSISEDGGKSWKNPEPEIKNGTDKAAVLFPPMEKPLRNPQTRNENGNKISNLDNPLLGYRPHDKCGTGIKGKSKSYENDNCGHYHLEMCANGFAVVNGKLYAIAEVAKGINNPGIGRIVREIKTDGKPGNIFWLNDDVPNLRSISPNAINIEVYEKNVVDKKLIGKITSYLQNPFHMPQWDFYNPGWMQRDGKYTKEWEAADGTPGTCEPTYSYSLKEGTLVRLWRTKAKRLYAQFSKNQGKSWTEIEKTSFPDCGSRTNVGQLPDGKIYVINNAYHGGRNPLVISLSENGKKFNKAFLVRSGEPGPKDDFGRAKVDGYQYPHSVVVDDYLLVMYSINKESIAVTRLPLKSL